MGKAKSADADLHLVECGSGLPLLLVHGFPLDHTMWAGQLQALAAHARLLAPDLRGFGRSAAGGEAVPMEQFADDLAALLDARGIREPVVFCGLSMGGYIGWQFFRRHRSRLRGLILCDTRAVADTPEAAEARRATADRVLAEGLGFLADGMLDKLFAAETRQRRPELVEATHRVMLAASPQGVAAALRGMAARPDVSTWLPQIDVPALLLCGLEDVISTPEEMRGIAQCLPQARFVEVPAAGHMSPLEQPRLVNEAIREFLNVLNA
jgi:3-oxoadipate enol-lactonase